VGAINNLFVCLTSPNKRQHFFDDVLFGLLDYSLPLA